MREYKRRRILATSSVDPTAATPSDTPENFFDNLDSLSSSSSSSPQTRSVLLRGAVTVNLVELPRCFEGEEQRPVLEYCKGRDRFLIVLPSATPSASPESSSPPFPPSRFATLSTLGRGVVNAADEVRTRSPLSWASLSDTAAKGRFYAKATGDEAMGPVGFVFSGSFKGAAAAKVLVVKSTLKAGEVAPEDARPVLDLMERTREREGGVLTEGEVEEVMEWLKAGGVTLPLPGIPLESS